MIFGILTGKMNLLTQRARVHSCIHSEPEVFSVRQQRQIVLRVIQAIIISVMNVFLSCEGAAKTLLHNNAMFTPPFAILTFDYPVEESWGYFFDPTTPRRFPVWLILPRCVVHGVKAYHHLDSVVKHIPVGKEVPSTPAFVC